MINTEKKFVCNFLLVFSIGSNHPLLNTISNYYFNAKTGGKNLRPTLVLLMSRATFKNENVPWILNENKKFNINAFKDDSIGNQSQSFGNLRDGNQSQSIGKEDQFILNQMNSTLNHHLIGSNWDSTAPDLDLLASSLHQSNSNEPIVHMTRQDYLKSRILPTQQRLAGMN